MRRRAERAATIDGSDDADAVGGHFTLLYAGPTGVDTDPGRRAWGPAIVFANAKPWRACRVPVTETRGDNTDATQYSEFRLGQISPP